MDVFIENPAGTSIKNIYNEKTFEFIKSRPYSRATPYAYGFIIGTTSGDDDALDCFVLSQHQLKPGQRISCEAIALVEYFEDDELDHKIVMTISNERNSLDDTGLQKIKEFLLHVFDHLPEKHVRVGRILGADDARQLIELMRT